jgi:hypothetical protein
MRTEVLEEVKKEIEKMLEVGFTGRVGMPNGFPALYPYRRSMAGGESTWTSRTSTGPH